MKKKYINDDLLNGLKEHNKKVIQYIYSEYFPMIKTMVLRSPGADTADAEDIFTLGLEAIYLLIIQEKIDLKCSFSSFLYAICYRQWCKELRKKSYPIDKQTVLSRLYSNSAADIEYYIEKAERLSLYQEKFKDLGESCQQILQMGFNGYSATEIAIKMGFKNAAYVHKKCSICRKKLTQLIHEDSRFREIKF